MMTPFRWVTGGGDQEKTTCLSPTSAANITGAAEGAVYKEDNKIKFRYNSPPSTMKCQSQRNMMIIFHTDIPEVVKASENGPALLPSLSAAANILTVYWVFGSIPVMIM